MYVKQKSDAFVPYWKRLFASTSLDCQGVPSYQSVISMDAVVTKDAVDVSLWLSW